MSPRNSVSEPVVSHGRGGAANITADNTPYADGEIVREGFTGDQGDGAYSSGRGGAANIGSPHVKPTRDGYPHDEDVIPETAIHEASHGQENFHVGRGGEGNIHKESQGKPHEGLADKLKHKLGLGKKS